VSPLVLHLHSHPRPSDGRRSENEGSTGNCESQRGRVGARESEKAREGEREREKEEVLPHGDAVGSGGSPPSPGLSEPISPAVGDAAGNGGRVGSAWCCICWWCPPAAELVAVAMLTLIEPPAPSWPPGLNMPRMLAPWIRLLLPKPNGTPEELPLPLGLHPVTAPMLPPTAPTPTLVPCPSWRDSFDNGSKGTTRDRARGAEALWGEDDEGEVDVPVAPPDAGGVVLVAGARAPELLPVELVATTLLARAELQSNNGAPAATSAPPVAAADEEEAACPPVIPVVAEGRFAKPVILPPLPPPRPKLTADSLRGMNADPAPWCAMPAGVEGARGFGVNRNELDRFTCMLSEDDAAPIVDDAIPPAEEEEVEGVGARMRGRVGGIDKGIVAGPPRFGVAPAPPLPVATPPGVWSASAADAKSTPPPPLPFPLPSPGELTPSIPYPPAWEGSPARPPSGRGVDNPRPL